MAFDKITYALCKKYTDNSIAGAGAIKGKNCVITGIDPITGGNRVTFQWTLDNGTVQTDTMDVMDGIDGADGATGPQGPQGPAGPAGADGHDGAPGADGQDGQDGITPVITITEITGGHRLTITTGSDVQTVDVLDGTDGQDGAPGQDGRDGVGVPEGGSQGQILKKASGSDYDTEWADDEGGQIIQVESLPTASSTEEGNIYQYIGTTGGGLTNGYFYECVFNDPNYIWQAKAVQDPGQALNGIPAGGNTNQILQKHSNADYDAEWVDPASYSQQQSDWAQSDNTQVDFIKNKPQNLVQDANYVHTDNNYTNAEASKLAAIEAGAQVNVKPDWNAAAGADDEILNKPTLGTAATKNVPVSGDAATTEVVMGDDSRLTDARTPVAHTHTTSEISDFPTLGTAAYKNVPASGDAATTEVVMGDDSRLTDARTPVAHTHANTDITGLGTASTKDSTNAVTQNDTKLVESGAVYTALSGKVDAVVGKGLSTNDYTDSDAAAVANLGTASTMGSTDTVTQNSHNLVESGGVYTAIANAISSVYKPAGSKTCSQLLSSLLVASNLGKVYNITDSGTTTADFVEGAGKPINPGDNVVIVDVGSSTYKFDLLSGFVDLTNYISKALTPSGLLRDDGTVDTTSYLTSTDISNKADKKVPSSVGNLAALDASGNLADSGKKTSAFIEKALSASGYLKDDGSVDTLLAGTVSSNTTAISNIKDGTTIDSFSDVESALSGKENTISDLSTIRSGAQAGSTAYQKPSGGIPSSDMSSAVQTSLSNADSAYQKPGTGIPSTDLASSVQTSLSNADSAYQKPSGGIPSTDLASTIQTSLSNADSAYQKPSGGVPKTDLDSAVQTSLDKADGAGYWVAGQDKIINTSVTQVQFTVPNAGYGYDPYFESADGTPVYVEGENKSGTTLTYTIRALTAAQLPCKAKLLAIPVASA